MNRPFLHLIGTFLACMVASASSPVSAQASDDGGTLLSCDLQYSRLKVDLQISDDLLTLRIGADLSNPDVLVTNTFAQTGYLPGAPTRLERDRVELIDDQGTVYAVSSAVNWVTRRVFYYGVVNIISPDDDRQEMHCDTMSSDQMRLRILAAHVTETPTQLIDRCLKTRQNYISGCFGIVAKVYMHHGICESMAFQDEGCWGPEGQVWDKKLAQIMTDAIAATRDLHDNEAANALQTSHDHWLAEREDNCAEGGDAWASGTPYCYALWTKNQVEDLLGFAEATAVNRLTTFP